MSFRNTVEFPTGVVLLISLLALSAAAQDALQNLRQFPDSTRRRLENDQGVVSAH